MADQPEHQPQKLPAWPLGCGLALLSLLLMVNVFAMVGVLTLAAGIVAGPGMALSLLAIALIPLAQLAGALWLRRRNPYAARTLAWGFALTLLFAGLLYLTTVILDRASGIGV